MAAAELQHKVASESPGPPVTRRRPWWRKLTFDKVSFMGIFLALPLAIYLIFVVNPLIQAIGYSFTNWSGFSLDYEVVGISNYTRIITDDIWLTAVRNNILLAFVMPLGIIILSLTLATLVTVGGSSHGQIRGLQGAGFYRVVSFFPYTIPGVIVGIMWGQIFDPSQGLVNGVLTGLGFEQFKSFAWLGNATTAMPVMMFVMAWGFIGFYMVLFVAAIKGIPAEIFEAARIDGAGRLRTAVSITIPLIRDNVQTAYVYLGILAIDMYVYAQSLFPFGGPENTTLVMSQELLTTAFQKGLFGVACAMGVFMGVVTMIFSAIVFVVNRLTGGRDQVTMA